MFSPLTSDCLMSVFSMFADFSLISNLCSCTCLFSLIACILQAVYEHQLIFII